MIPRLFCDLRLDEGAAVALSEAHHHYLRNVLRREVGGELRIFNSQDGEFVARIELLSKKACVAKLAKQVRPPQSGCDLWLLFAPVKRAPLDLIVQKATELGVSGIFPVLTERTNSARVKDDRLFAIAREAAEQCGRMSVPSVNEPATLESVLQAWPEQRGLLFCDEAGDDPWAQWGGDVGRAPPILDAVRTSAYRTWAVLVGPEGGFTPSERTMLRALPFVVPATIGPRILRADTAAIAALALVQAAAGDCG